MAVQQKQEMTWQERAGILSKADISWRQIANILKLPKSTVSDFLRKNYGPPSTLQEPNQGLFAEDIGDGEDRMDWPDKPPYVLRPGAVPYDNSRILFISDMHIPYHSKGLLPFLEGLKVRYNPTRVICLGDELDKHAMSFHDSDPDLPSAGDELKKALPIIKEVEKLFPKMDLIDSNHGSLLYRKAKHHGIPRHYLRGYNEVLEVGDGWKWHFDLTLTLPDDQKVYVHHGKGANALRVAQLMGMSYVAGHYHESFGVQYCSTPANLIWAMQCGCLIDRKSLAFAYSNNNMKRQVIGTGLIIDGVPVMEAMPL
jgi:hypothetical protein